MSIVLTVILYLVGIVSQFMLVTRYNAKHQSDPRPAYKKDDYRLGLYFSALGSIIWPLFLVGAIFYFVVKYIFLVIMYGWNFFTHIIELGTNLWIPKAPIIKPIDESKSSYRTIKFKE